MRIRAQKRWKLREIDALVREFLRLVARRLAANRTRGCFVVMNLARFLGKPPADIFGIANDFAQLCEHVARQPGDGVVARRALGIRRLRRRGTFATRGLGHPDLRRRDALYADVIAYRARDERVGFLPIELFRGGKPSFEAMAVRAGEVKNDHDQKTGRVRRWLTLSIESKLMRSPWLESWA